MTTPSLPDGAAVVGCLILLYRFIDGFQTKKDSRETRDLVQSIATKVDQTGVAVQQGRLAIAENTSLTQEVKEQVEKTNGRVTVLEAWRAVMEHKAESQKRKK